MKLSVVIPTYKEPEYLDLCLQTCFGYMTRKDIEVIVVVDGFYDLNKEVLAKYKSNSLRVLDLKENKGLAIATNVGANMASGEYVLIVNDDNVFPPNWEQAISQIEEYGNSFPTALSLNQIEPKPSMFRQFIIKHFGTSPSDFDLHAYEYFCINDLEAHSKGYISSGSTLPIILKRKHYLMVGGWDTMYPSPHVVDWDFFLKLRLAGLRMFRSYEVAFYHFAGAATRSTPEQDAESNRKEHLAHVHANLKWGAPIKHSPDDNRKYL